MTETFLAVGSTPFEAARYVTSFPEGNRSRNLHGHSFIARVRALMPPDWASLGGAQVDAVRAAVNECVAPLNYSLLNERVESPSDANLARWIREQVSLPSISSVSIRSGREQGVDLSADGHAHIWRRFRFEAAHQLPNVPEGHKCGRMHGHGFEVVLHADQGRDSAEQQVDVGCLEEAWLPLYRELHYSCLNDLPGLENPTSEILASWIWDRVGPRVPSLSGVTVYETTSAGCHYRPGVYRIWKEVTFESAVGQLLVLEGSGRRCLHGHSYVLRLHVSAPLDEAMGWTMDYGDVKECFRPVYAQLDHQRLDTINGLETPEIAGLLAWIRERVQGSLPQLDRIDLLETPGCGGILCWGEREQTQPA